MTENNGERGGGGRGLLGAISCSDVDLLQTTYKHKLQLQAFTWPLYVAAALRRAGGDSHLEAALWRVSWQEQLQQDHYLPLLYRLLLCACTASNLYVVTWLLLLLPLGDHSLMGWCWAGVSFVWWGVLWGPSVTLQVRNDE